MKQLARSMFALPLAVLLLTGAAARANDNVPNDAKLIQPLKVGAKAPAFEAKSADGKPFRFTPEKLSKPVVMIFYRGGWCPYCNTHLGQLNKAEPELMKLGYDVLFFSADKPELLYPSLKDRSIKYALLSDATMEAARAFGVAFKVDDATVAQYKKFGIDLEAASGQKHHELPVPAVFVIDKGGVIRFAYANPDYKVRLEADKIVAAARAAL